MSWDYSCRYINADIGFDKTNYVILPEVDNFWFLVLTINNVMNLNDFKFSSDIHLKRIFVSIRVMKVQSCYVLFVARSICTSLYTSQSFERREECNV